MFMDMYNGITKFLDIYYGNTMAFVHIYHDNTIFINIYNGNTMFLDIYYGNTVFFVDITMLTSCFMGIYNSNHILLPEGTLFKASFTQFLSLNMTGTHLVLYCAPRGSSSSRCPRSRRRWSARSGRCSRSSWCPQTIDPSLASRPVWASLTENSDEQTTNRIRQQHLIWAHYPGNMLSVKAACLFQATEQTLPVKGALCRPHETRFRLFYLDWIYTTAHDSSIQQECITLIKSDIGSFLEQHIIMISEDHVTL